MEAVCGFVGHFQSIVLVDATVCIDHKNAIVSSAHTFLLRLSSHDESKHVIEQSHAGRGRIGEIHVEHCG